MIKFSSKEQCCGCNACGDIYPKQITEKFKINVFTKKRMIVPNHKNLEICFNHTSGGIFSAIAEKSTKRQMFRRICLI